MFINEACKVQFVIILEKFQKIITIISAQLCKGALCKESLIHERVLLFSGQYLPYSWITSEQKSIYTLYRSL